MSHTAPMTFEQAWRRAGAARLTPDDEVAILQHCGQMMAELKDLDGHARRFVCRTCGASITHIDGRGSPAPITPAQRHRAEESGELWTVGSDPMGVLQSRGPGGTGHA